MNEETIRQTIANEQNELGNVYKEIDARTITKATNKQTKWWNDNKKQTQRTLRRQSKTRKKNYTERKTKECHAYEWHVMADSGTRHNRAAIEGNT